MTEQPPEELPSYYPAPDHPLMQKSDRIADTRDRLADAEARLESRGRAGRLLGKVGVLWARGRVERATRSYSKELLNYKRPGYKPFDKERF